MKLSKFFIIHYVPVFVSLIIILVLGSGCGSNSMEYCLESGECDFAVDVVKVSSEIPIDPNDLFWKNLSHIQFRSIELGPQMITNPKWPDPSTKSVKIAGVQNGSEMAILLEWDDATLENKIEVSATHTDQAALMFPIHQGKEVPLITMGSENEIVNIWQWRAIWETSLQEKTRNIDRNSRILLSSNTRRSPVEDLTAAGFSTLTTQEEQNVMGRGTWMDKTWRVVFKRTLVSSDNADIQFKYPVVMAIAIWNGGNGERNGQKAISNWMLLRL
jgi:hypothetical protein